MKKDLQVVARGMADRGEGVVLNIASMCGIRPLTRIPGYSAAKAGLANFTQWLAVDLAQNHSPNIRVNALAPGFFLTQQNEFLLKNSRTGKWTPRGKQSLTHTPAGRFGKPEDLIGPLIFYLSNASSFTSGTILPVDGAFAAYSGV